MESNELILGAILVLGMTAFFYTVTRHIKQVGSIDEGYIFDLIGRWVLAAEEIFDNGAARREYVMDTARNVLDRFGVDWSDEEINAAIHWAVHLLHEKEKMAGLSDSLDHFMSGNE